MLKINKFFVGVYFLPENIVMKSIKKCKIILWRIGIKNNYNCQRVKREGEDWLG